MKTYILMLLLLLLFVTTNQAQTIKGKITANKAPVEQATVVVENTSYGTTSNTSGHYELNFNTAGTYTVKCSYVGFETVGKTVTLTEGEILNLDFELSVAENSVDEITVVAQLSHPVRQTGENLFTGTAITTKGIELMGVAAQTSIYSALQLMPTITVGSADAFGLSEKEMRNRGIRSLYGGLTIEGFPNYGIMPIGARDYIYDTENMEQISVFSGAVPADLGSATGSRGGVIELKYKRPQENTGLTVSQSVATDNYSRSFVRFDSGKLPAGLGVFGSYSYTTADKWKGAGKLAERHNAAFGIGQQLKAGFKWELFGNYSLIDRHFFKPLNFGQSSDIENNFELDYVTTLSTVPQEAADYFDYNKGTFENKDLLLTTAFSKSKAFHFLFKAYYSTENANYTNTVVSADKYQTQDRTRDITRMGFMPSVNGEIRTLKYNIGYWLEIFDNNVYVWNNAITPNGLQPKGYSFYTVPDGVGYIHSPYAKMAVEFGSLNVQAGVKYFYFEEPSAERFKSQTDNPNLLTDEPMADLASAKIIGKAFLPSVGVGYQLSDIHKIYLNYGRNFMRPYMYVPTISLYLQNKAAFNAQNLTLQSIYDQWHIETSDNIDLGVQLSGLNYKLNPSLYYSLQQNVLTSLYDERVQLNYYQNGGTVQTYGASAETYLQPAPHVMLYVNPAYTRIYFTQNILRKSEGGAQKIEIENNQIPATPVFSGKAGITYTNTNFDISLNALYEGDRFGDATNIEKIPNYFLLNGSLKFYIENIRFVKRVELSAEIKNILNRKYISIINVSDDSANGQATYLTGFPRSFIVNFLVKI